MVQLQRLVWAKLHNDFTNQPNILLGDVETRYMCHSIRKSPMSILYGIPAVGGKIDLSKTLTDLNIDDTQPQLSPEENQATVSDLLKSRYIP